MTISATDRSLRTLLARAVAHDDYETVSATARALLGNPEMRELCASMVIVIVASARSAIDARTDPCYDECPGWALMNEDARPEVQRCDACFEGFKDPPTDSDMGLLPEAIEAMEPYLSGQDNGSDSED